MDFEVSIEKVEAARTSGDIHKVTHRKRGLFGKLQKEISDNKTSYIVLLLISVVIASILSVLLHVHEEIDSLYDGRVMNVQERIIDRAKNNKLTETDKSIINSFSKEEVNNIKEILGK